MKHVSRRTTNPTSVRDAGWRRRATAAVFLLLAALVAGRADAQGYGGPLAMEGLHQQTNPSAASRALGGVTIGGGQIGLMFRNPSTLRSLDGLRISVAGSGRSSDLRQTQHFAPVRYYPNLSLLLENRTDPVPDPDPDLVGFTPADSVQRPFDDMQPNWSHSLAATRPVHALIAVPFSIGGVSLTAGAGAVQYANLDHYYRNNNVLDPAVLSTRPLPTTRPTDDDPITADWYQSTRSREGVLRGYGGALSAHVERYNLTLGVSGLLVDGSSDDVEERIERGTLTFYANEFRADSSGGRVSRIGSSDFSAAELTAAALLVGDYVSVGFTVTAPTTYTRDFAMQVEADTSGTPVSSTLNGSEELELPWRGSVGLRLEPREGVRIGLEYEFRPYASATLTNNAQETSSPWPSSSLFRIGTEYDPASWLSIRGGIRGESEVFVPDGRSLDDAPVSYRVYSAGLGLRFGGVRWNVAYEHAGVKYSDIWGSAISRNTISRHTLVTEISFTVSTAGR